LVAESALNRYSVRPCESTRIDPRLLLATRTVAVFVDVVVAFAGFGDGDAVAAPPPPPQAAMAKAASGITAALARKVIGLLRVMLAPSVGEHRQSQR
jgi:hypothetical protein